MDNREFLNNPNYVRYIELFLQYNNLLAERQEENAETEALCDAMEPLWYKLSAAEMERGGIISADLDMLTGDEVFRNVPPEQCTEAWLAPRLQEARLNNDWGAVLALLRNGPDYMTPDELAYQRSAAYQQLGHCEIALLFADYAYKSSVQKRNSTAAVAA